MSFLVANCVFFVGPLSMAYAGLFDRYTLTLLPFAMLLIFEGMGLAHLHPLWQSVPGRPRLVSRPLPP